MWLTLFSSWDETDLDAVLAVAEKANTTCIVLFWEYLNLVSMFITDQKYRF